MLGELGWGTHPQETREPPHGPYPDTQGLGPREQSSDLGSPAVQRGKEHFHSATFKWYSVPEKFFSLKTKQKTKEMN